MTTPPAVELRAANPKDGCSVCRSRYTVQITSYKGRLCSRHAVLPTIRPGPYDRSLALEMVDLGRVDAALSYLRCYLTREIDARFRRAVQAVTG